MNEAVMLVLVSIINGIDGPFESIFPEFPLIGFILASICTLLFVIYVFKSGFRQAIMISLGLFIIATILIFFLHKMITLFSLAIHHY